MPLTLKAFTAAEDPPQATRQGLRLHAPLAHAQHTEPQRDTAMSNRHYTAHELDELRNTAKRVTNPGARWADKPGHRQRNFQVVAQQGDPARFMVYLRQNQQDVEDFSCGIAYLPPGGGRLTLARYNGSSHVHGEIAYRPHIHSATAQAIAAGRKPEAEAWETNRYTTLDGAFRCLIEDFSLSGITPPDPEQPMLPYGS